MMDEDKVLQLLEDALVMWRSIQTRARKNVSIQKFSDYLGVSKSLFIAWQEKKRKLTHESRNKIAKPIADLVGPSAYEILEVNPPNPYLQSIINRFENIPADKQRILAKDAIRYETEDNEEHIKKSSKRRKKASNH